MSSFFSFLAKTIRRINKCPLGRRNSIWILRRYIQTERNYGMKMKWLLNAGFPTKFLSHTPHPPLPFPFHSAGQFWVFDYRDHLSDFVYIYSLCWDLSELWFFVRVPVNSKVVYSKQSPTVYINNKHTVDKQGNWQMLRRQGIF